MSQGALELNVPLRRLDALGLASGQGWEQSPARSRSSTLGFCFFILLNAILFIRPAEIFPSLMDLPIYEFVFLACLATTGSVILEQLKIDSLKRNPATLCVVALLIPIILSPLTRANFYDARVAATDFVKVVLYLLMMRGLLDTPRRLAVFIAAISLFIFVLTALSLLQYHEIIHLDALSAMREMNGAADENGDVTEVVRLRACGIFGDPNDFSLVLVSALLIQLHKLVTGGKFLRRLCWLIPAPAILYAFALTKSRGGLLGLLAGLATYLISRAGWRRGLVVGLIVFPALFFGLGGRQTDIDLENSEDTAQGRIQLWREGMALFESAPVLGVGYEQFADYVDHVAHNSYVHVFAELGFVGGTLFVGAAFLPLTALRRISKARCELEDIDPDLAGWLPCLSAMLIAYLVGIFSLSRAYGYPTYLIFGLVGAYATLVARDIPQVTPALNSKMVRNVIQASFVVLIGLEVFVRIFAV